MLLLYLNSYSTSNVISTTYAVYIQGDHNFYVHLTISVRKYSILLLRPSQNTLGMWSVLYSTRSWRTQFGLSIYVWRIAGDTLNITSNFLYCNHQVHRDFFITLYCNTLHYARGTVWILILTFSILIIRCPEMFLIPLYYNTPQHAISLYISTVCILIFYVC